MSTTDSRISQRAQSIPEPIVHVMRQKVESMRALGRSVLDFTQAQISSSPPASIMAFLSDFNPSDPAFRLLGAVPGLPKLRDRIASYRRTRFAVPIAAENVLVTAGANHAAALALTTIADPGDAILLPDPYFFNHYMTVLSVGCRPALVPLDKNSNFGLDPDRVEEAWTPSTRAILLTQPSNPTATVHSTESLVKLLEIAARNDGWLIIDESYEHFIYPPQPSAPTLLFPSDRTILLGSFSKSLSLAGWRVGYLISHSSIVERAVRVQDATLIHPTALSQHLALIGIESLPDHLAKIMPEMDERRKAMLRLLEENPTFSEVFGDAAIFVFARLSGDFLSIRGADQLLERFGVATLPGSSFGQVGENFLRIAYGINGVKEISTAFREPLELIGTA